MRFFEIGNRFADRAAAQVDFAKVVIGVVVVGIKLGGFGELLLRQVYFAHFGVTSSKIGTRRHRFRIEANGRGKMLVGF